MGRPAMQVTQKHAGSHYKLQVLHVRICLRNRWMVIKHEQDASRDQDKKRAQGERTQIPRRAEFQSTRTDFHRKKMKKDVLLDGLGAVQIAGAASAAEYRAPDFRIPDPVKLFFDSGGHGYTFTYSGSFNGLERSTIRLPSSASQTFSHGSGCGAGPATFTPSRLKRLPWHGHAIKSSSGFHAVRQPRWVQIAPRA